MIFPISKLQLLGSPWRAVGEGSFNQSPQNCFAVQTKFVEICSKPLHFQNKYSWALFLSDWLPDRQMCHRAAPSRLHVLMFSIRPPHSPARSSVSLCSSSSSSSLSSSLESPGRGPHTPSPISNTPTQQVAHPNGESAHTDCLLHFFFSGMPLG